MQGADLTAQCTGKLFNTNYADQRSGFYVLTTNDVVLTLSGPGDKQVLLNPDTAVQPIDMVIVGRGGTSKSQPAIGKCAFANPFKGPSKLLCEATTNSSRYEVVFDTDGTAPKRLPL
jgi:hypothetical protein